MAHSHIIVGTYAINKVRFSFHTLIKILSLILKVGIGTYHNSLTILFSPQLYKIEEPALLFNRCPA